MLVLLNTYEMVEKKDQSVSQIAVPATTDEIEMMYGEENLNNITFSL
jgi:hypothetical protein